MYEKDSKYFKISKGGKDSTHLIYQDNEKIHKYQYIKKH